MGKPTSGGAGGSGGRQRAEPAPETPPPPVITPPPARNITVSGNGLRDLQAMVGRRLKLSAEDVGDMIGAPDGSKIMVGSDGNGNIYLDATHSDVDLMSQQLWREDGKLVLYNNAIILNPDAPKGMGTQIITRQVAAARKTGISSIELNAAGYPGSKNMNGYYTWSRLGFNAEIPDYKVSNMPAEIKGTMRNNTMLELYRTQAGRDWWKANGNSMNMEFDTKANSKSSQALDAYNEERRNRSG